MRRHLLVTVTGPDRPGLVDCFTHRLVDGGGNVEASRMARLGGDFAMLALVSVDSGAEEACRRQLQGLGSAGLGIEIRDASPVPADAATGRRYALQVEGADHEGIIHAFANALAQRGVNIETLDTSVQPAPMSGAPLFSMAAVIQAPDDLAREDLEALLESRAADAHVDIGLDAL